MMGNFHARHGIGLMTAAWEKSGGLFTPVNYVQGNTMTDFLNGAYVDLGFKPDFGFHFDVVASFHLDSDYSENWQSLFGGRHLSGDQDYQLSQNVSNRHKLLRIGRNGSYQFYQSGLFSDSFARYYSDSVGNYKLQDGSYSGKIALQSSGYSGQNLILFGLKDDNMSGGRVSQLSNFKIKTAKFWNSTGLMRDLSPVVRNDDGIAGFIDSVSGTFFSSANPDYQLRYG